RRDLTADFPLAKHGDSIGEGEHFFQFMRDDEDRFSLGLQHSEIRKQLFHFGRSQNRRRLVENQDLAMTIERLQDLDPLLDSDWKRFNTRIEGNIQSVLLREFLEACSSARSVNSKQGSSRPALR